MKIEEHFLEDEIEKAKQIIVNFHDRTLLDKEVDNTSAIILSTYMVSNSQKKRHGLKGGCKRFVRQNG